MTTFVPEMRLFDNEGQRLYLTASERQRFLEASDNECREDKMFFHVLHYTGCRPSEALELTPSMIQLNEKEIVFRTMKKRKLDNQGRKRKPQFRAVPVPEFLTESLDLTFDLRGKKDFNQPLWTMERSTAWRKVKKIMARAGIVGPMATSKGLRHAYGITMIEGGAPVTLVRDLLGHAETKTTEIYLQVVGSEKRNLVMNAWK